MVDAARLADELRAEQDHAQTQEKLRKALETQIKELQVLIYIHTQSLQTDASKFIPTPHEQQSSSTNLWNYDVLNDGRHKKFTNGSSM